MNEGAPNAPALVVGLMSGTSADGIDAALVEIGEFAAYASPKTQSGVPRRLRAGHLWLSVRAFTCVPYAPDVRRRLFALFDVETARIDELTRLDRLIGRAFAEAARSVCDQAGVDLTDVAAIGSHGQTVHHLPPSADDLGGTLQIGRAAEIAQLTGCTVVNDFRARDVAAGGQGAPLVPYVDLLLFGHPEQPRWLQNLGGIGNVTVMPAGGDIGALRAFDTGPGNMLIDALVDALSGGTQRADWDGIRATRGTPDARLLREWLAHPYFALAPPKSTGRELFGKRFAASALRRAAELDIADDDLVSTATAFTAHSVADQLERFAPAHQGGEMIVSGGGAANPALMRMLAEALPDLAVRTIDEYGIQRDAKEAVAFALLAYETLRGRPTNVPAATGACERVVLGAVTPGRQLKGI